MLAPAFRTHYHEVPIIKTTASKKEGVEELLDILSHQLKKSHLTDKRFWLLAEKAFYLIQQKRMRGVDKEELKKQIESAYVKGGFNLYQFIEGK
jgi:LAO/AO transport system kinase